ncbi:DNA repair protein RecN [Novispirillum itersonii]|uniref:DNA repair protein RecN n=1 Tax=Novispirillum itersonii TaxID=189 RepID=UPI000375AD25|nr:DNA repair protein RecN [Novispirillum itersonii]
MLVRLSIRDVVLIDRLDLSFADGLGVLTGETGAGKSILLDSLGLALGDRADAGLVRSGADQLSVTAEFDLPKAHPARDILKDQGIAEEDMLIVRRTVTRDGRSRASINDQSASVGLLRRIGETLVEVHGQFDTHGLLDPATHRSVLDAYAGPSLGLTGCRAAWKLWQAARAARDMAERDMKAARDEEDTLRHAEKELSALKPQRGEEADLAERRQTLMNGEKLADGLNGALASLTPGGADIATALRGAQRHLERIAGMAGPAVSTIIDALERAAIEAAEAHELLERTVADIDLDPRRLEEVEERLFALRAVARKHGCEVGDLPSLLDTIRRRLAALEDGGSDLARLAKEEQGARLSYIEAARAISRARQAAAGRLDGLVATELPPLKLDRARFVTTISDLPEDQWGPEGLDRVAFEVATNPGAAPGPLGKIASGGELARFMLALKVVLARVSSVPTLVFDEVDAGIGGATAAAVGERLARLADDVQVLVVTHSPQVAAKARRHWKVAKFVTDGQTVTTVSPLSEDDRLEEVARMLSGESITDHARAAAASLMA